MTEVKPWYQSKTIIVSIIGAIFGLLAAFNMLPEGIDQEQVVAIVMTITSVLAAFFRKSATAEIGSQTSMRI